MMSYEMKARLGDMALVTFIHALFALGVFTALMISGASFYLAVVDSSMATALWGAVMGFAGLGMAGHILHIWIRPTLA